MNWFRLDPQSVMERVAASPTPVTAPTLAASVIRGVVGFTLVSVAGFAPWAVLGKWLHEIVGELGMYVACAVVFLGLSGLALHRLIIGPGSLVRFYQIFGVAFTAYAIAWIAGWMGLRGHTGSLSGLFVGTAVMGAIFAWAFQADRKTMFATIAALFVLNTLGYYVGGWVEGTVMGLPNLSLMGLAVEKAQKNTLAQLLWGVCYGIGLGAGLGVGFWWCQGGVRKLLTETERS